MTWFNDKRIAVVGNGPNALLNTRDIDEFDTVIRFNRFALDPDRRDHRPLGKRTDIYAVAVNYPPAVHQTPRLVQIGARAILDTSMVRTKQHEKTAHRIRLAMPQAEWLSVPLDVFLGMRVFLGTRPTSGAAAVEWILRDHSPAEVYVTGFAFEDKHEAAAGHYYEDPDVKFNYAMHRPSKELEWFRALAGRDSRLTFDSHITRKLGLS